MELLPADIVELVPCGPRPARDLVPLVEVAFKRDAWLPDELAVLRTRFEAGDDMDAIAAAVGRRRAGVATKLLELGFRRNVSLPWSEFDDGRLVELYGTVATSEIAALLGRTAAAVYARAGILGLTEGNAPPWSAWEDAQLAEGYARGIVVAHLAALIGRTPSAAVTRASHCGLQHANRVIGWSEAEEVRLLQLAEAGERYLSIAKILAAEGFPERSKVAVNQTLHRLGYERGWGRDWTEDEELLVRRTYREGGSVRALALRLGRTTNSLRWKAADLGLQGSHPRPNGFRQGPDWTEEEDHILRRYYSTMRAKDVADLVGRNKAAVYNRAFVLGLEAGYFKAWRPEEDTAIGIALRQGLSISLLARACNRDVAVVSKRAIKLGHDFKHRSFKLPRSKQPGALTLAEILALEPDASGATGST